jgi:hypothetical protein
LRAVASGAVGLWTTGFRARACGGFVFADALHHVGASGFGRSGHDFTAGWFAQAAPNGLATHGNGLGAFGGLRPKAFYRHHWNFLLGKALNVSHKAFFVQANQIHGLPFFACAAGAANAVHIVFGHVGNFVIDHVGQIVNVNAAGGNVGSDQCAQAAAFKARQSLGACALAFVAVQRHGSDAIFF